MTTDNTCPRVGKLWGRCRWEGRYDRGEANMAGANLQCSAGLALAAMEKMRPITYIRDVCVTCGKTIERAE